jgi:hypothetical protein
MLIISAITVERGKKSLERTEAFYEIAEWQFVIYSKYFN